MPRKAEEWQTYDGSAGSTHPTYSSLGSWYAPLSLKEITTSSINSSFEDIQEWIADACANCLHRWDRTKSWDFIQCLTGGRKSTTSRYAYKCPSYQFDPTLDEIRGIIFRTMDFSTLVSWKNSSINIGLDFPQSF